MLLTEAALPVTSWKVSSLDFLPCAIYTGNLSQALWLTLPDDLIHEESRLGWETHPWLHVCPHVLAT